MGCGSRVERLIAATLTRGAAVSFAWSAHVMGTDVRSFLVYPPSFQEAKRLADAIENPRIRVRPCRFSDTDWATTPPSALKCCVYEYCAGNLGLCNMIRRAIRAFRECLPQHAQNCWCLLVQPSLAAQPLRQQGRAGPHL